MRSPRFRLLPLLLGLATAPTTASSQETTLANDSTVNGVPSTAGATTAQFVAGEVMAAWFTSTCNGDVVAAEIYWASQFGGGPSTFEQSISILSSATFPNPGPPLANQGGGNAIIVGPMLQDSVMNQFRFLDPGNSVPLRAPVAAGQSFGIALQFANTHGPSPFAPGPTWDLDGCQAGLNAYDATPGSWVDACLLGVTGDFVVRAVVDCAPVVPMLGIGAQLTLVALLLLMGKAGVVLVSRLR